MGVHGVYTPQSTVDWEQLVGQCAMIAMSGRQPLTGPVRVRIAFGGTNPSGDLDNYAKAVLDAMNTIVFDDDRQVSKLDVWRDQGDPGVSVMVQVIK